MEMLHVRGGVTREPQNSAYRSDGAPAKGAGAAASATLHVLRNPLEGASAPGLSSLGNQTSGLCHAPGTGPEVSVGDSGNAHLAAATDSRPLATTTQKDIEIIDNFTRDAERELSEVLGPLERGEIAAVKLNSGDLLFAERKFRLEHLSRAYDWEQISEKVGKAVFGLISIAGGVALGFLSYVCMEIELGAFAAFPAASGALVGATVGACVGIIPAALIDYFSEYLYGASLRSTIKHVMSTPGSTPIRRVLSVLEKNGFKVEIDVSRLDTSYAYPGPEVRLRVLKR